MGRWHRNPFVWAAWGVVTVALLLPLGAMLLRSVTFHEVVLKDGRVHRAVGEVVVGSEDVVFDIQLEGEDEKRSWMEAAADVAEVRTVFSLDHYGRVFGDARTLGLLRNSVLIGLGGALLALLLGLPVAWVVVRAAPRSLVIGFAIVAGILLLAWAAAVLLGASPRTRLVFLLPLVLAAVLGLAALLAWLLWGFVRGNPRRRLLGFVAAALAALVTWLPAHLLGAPPIVRFVLLMVVVLGTALASLAFLGWLVFGGGTARRWPPALLGALCLGPAVLPPFFIALGGARTMQGWLLAAFGAEGFLPFGIEGASLQILNSILVFGCVLFPLPVLLVGPALAAVPAGPWEAARLLGGRHAAWRRVTLPAVLPAIAGAFVLSFVIALTDFAVPDVLGFMLPKGAPAHVFATEILLQWKQHGNTARAVATGAPFVLVTVALLFLALWLIRRSPAFHEARGARRRPRVRLGPCASGAGAAIVTAVLLVSLVLPLAGIASWAGAGAESTAGGTTNPAAGSSIGASLFDFGGTLDRTTGSREERDRWLKTALAAALLAMFVAAPLARMATRGGRGARAAVFTIGALPLAVPGLVLGAGTLILWQAVPGTWIRPLEDWIVRSTLVLTAKFLPFALLASWLALRALRPGHEEAAAMLGARPWTRAWRVVAPAGWTGVCAGGLLVLVLALRELDTVVLIDARILPMRLYDKIHFNRMADEANLLFLCLAYLLGPAFLGALLAALRPRLPRWVVPAVAGCCGLAALLWVLWDAPWRALGGLLSGLLS